ncbi:MAG: ABC transporter ATP-binding protein [Armatimonadota bacterium]|nr:ABC transporter ATP-binding protein [Armatimonadota bacterium]
MSTVIETQALTKRYGDLVAVDNLNLRLQAGEVFGLLGPNGSGKTTTILMLLGLTEPTSGSATVLGVDPLREPLAVKRRVGYMPDAVGFYDELTARENLRYTARLNGIPRRETEEIITEVLGRMGLADVMDRPVGTFSRGMRQRLGLADVLLKKPQIAILDEPTAGLDPEAAHEFLDLIRSLRRDGITVLLASHLLHQVQAVCDRVGLFSKGRMVLEGTFEELSTRVLGGSYRIQIEVKPDSLDRVLAGVPGVVRVTTQRPGLYSVEARADCRSEVARRIVAEGGQLLELRFDRASLDDVYARYFQEARSEA